MGTSPCFPTCHFPQLAYNDNVPTPFYHLSVAQDLLSHPKLSPQVRNFLHQHRPAFILGKTAPDVQVISGQARETTHFYTIPVHDLRPAWEQMLVAHPSLANASILPPDQAAFLAGYFCHLQADQLWALEIFNPIFGPDQVWKSFRQRLYLHNVLRAHLDQQVLGELLPEVRAALETSAIHRWLPFVEDRHLKDWRDYLAEQLQPGTGVQTIDVFARRQGLSVAAFEQLLSSQERMNREVFAHISLERLADYRLRVLAGNQDILNTYLKFLSRR